MEQENVRSDRVPMIRSGGTKHYQLCIDLIRRNLCVSWVASLVRIGVVVLVFAFREVLMAQNVWAFLFYMLLALIDIISLIGEINTYQFLRKQEKTLQNIDEQRRQGTAITERVRVGDYNTYLSPYETIYQYKFGYKPTASSYTIIRYLHTITTFAVFGALGLKESRVVESAIPETLVLAFVVLSVYVVNFELDYLELEVAKGKYQQIESLSEGVKQQIVSKFILWRRVVAGMYSTLLIVLIAGLVMIICLEQLAETVILLVATSISIVVVIFNACFQLYLTRPSGELSERVAFPSYTDRISSPYHLMFELKSAYPRRFVLLNTGTRVVLFCLFMVTMYCSSVLQDSTLSVLLSCVILCVAAEIIKIIIGHRMRIDYFLPVSLTTEKRVSMTCSICLSNYVDNVTQVELPCSSEHTFHKGCLENWMRSKKQCPLCRYDLGQFMK